MNFLMHIAKWLDLLMNKLHRFHRGPFMIGMEIKGLSGTKNNGNIIGIYNFIPAILAPRIAFSCLISG